MQNQKGKKKSQSAAVHTQHKHSTHTKSTNASTHTARTRRQREDTHAEERRKEEERCGCPGIHAETRALHPAQLFAEQTAQLMCASELQEI